MNKGLCVTCEHDTKCTFQVKLPVVQCEEFSTGEAGTLKVKSASVGSSRRSCSCESDEE